MKTLYGLVPKERGRNEGGEREEIRTISAHTCTPVLWQPIHWQKSAVWYGTYDIEPAGGRDTPDLLEDTIGPCSKLAEQFNRVCHNTTKVEWMLAQYRGQWKFMLHFILRSLHSVIFLQKIVRTTGASTHCLHHTDTLSLKVSFLLVKLSSFDHTNS